MKSYNYFFILSSIFLLTICLTSCEKAQYKADCCRNTLSVYPPIEEEGVYIYAANAFTPNADGVNDVYEVSFGGIIGQNFNFRIYKKNKLVWQSCERYA